MNYYKERPGATEDQNLTKYLLFNYLSSYENPVLKADFIGLNSINIYLNLLSDTNIGIIYPSTPPGISTTFKIYML
jgi:hypothetical protein